MKPQVAIIGVGYVGKAMYNLFKDHYDVVLKDAKNIITTSSPSQTSGMPAMNTFTAKEGEEMDLVNQAKLAVVCVPTPMNKDGSCDTSIVEEVVAGLSVPVILIKSTVRPGFTDYLKQKYNKRIVFSPEYIGQGNYFVPYWKYPDSTDMKKHSFVILGGEKKDTRYVLSFMTPVLGPAKTYFQIDAINAELVKYAENMWGAMKVSWANEMFEVCKALGGDWTIVREGWALDERVDKFHTLVFPHKRGWGGKCYPKDVNALVKAAKEAGYDPKLLAEVIKSNERHLKLNKELGEEDATENNT